MRASDLAIRKNYSAEICFECTVLKILKQYRHHIYFSFIDSFACNSSCVFVKLNDVILKERSKKFNIPQRSLQKVIILEMCTFIMEKQNEGILDETFSNLTYIKEA